MDPITDEELAGLDADLPWMETRIRKAALPDSGLHWGREWARSYREDVPRLIAALKAGREREAEYLEALRRCEEEGDGIAGEAKAYREEVERLKGDHAAFFPTLVVPAGGVTIGGPLPEPLLLVPAPSED